MRLWILAVVVEVIALIVGWRVDHVRQLTQPTLFWCFVAFSLSGCALGWGIQALRDSSVARRLAGAAAALFTWRVAYFPLMVICGWLGSIGEWVLRPVLGRSLVYPTFLGLTFAVHLVIALVATAALALPAAAPPRGRARALTLVTHPPRPLLWLVGALALPVAAMVSFSKPSDLSVFSDRPWRESRPIPPIHDPERNPYEVILREHEMALPAKVLALNAYVTYPLVPEGPWGSAMKGTLEALALENPVATSQQRVDEHYLAYLAAHQRLAP